MMKLEQKRFGKGLRTFTLEGDRIRFNYRSFSLTNEWFVNLAALDTRKSETKRRSISSLVFTFIFVLVLNGCVFGMLINDRNSDAFMVSVVFGFLSLIPLSLGIYKSISESHHWIIINYLNGNPALYFHPNTPSKAELDSFISEVFSAVDSIRLDGGEINRSIEILNSHGLLSPEEYQSLLVRSVSKS